MSLKVAIANWTATVRPKTLPAAVGPVILGLALAFNQTHQINTLVATLTLLTTLLLQIGSNLVNDYFDHLRGVDSTTRLGPLRATQSGLLAPWEVKRGYLLSFLLALLLAIPLMITGGWVIITIGFISIITAYCYTGGPYPLSHFALGEILALIFFGPVAVAGSYYLQTEQLFSWEPIIAGLIPGGFAAAIMAVNNLRDIASDHSSGKSTIATLVGRKNGGRVVLFFILLPAVISSILAYRNGQPLLLVAIFTLLLIKPHLTAILTAPPGQELNQTLARTGQLLFLYSLVTAGIIIL
ncbi:MAG: 1,4-dihydroxy-2-naphthoate octaprenyltransferase [Bdellovibrionales bacterium]|jgi:1,4-dihydroxy-2-naphthoate polyprenyltransferase|nr:1,4-dihydroxy-2-naphthoate octaprenyltransferase [Bdellovibrionales bacterium]MBT3525395.1 1,4-dihydroxy-2-naphthoate octaprenyltransferase [Bdellovibrionales bacterium]